MRRPVAPVLLFAICGGLSCAVFGPTRTSGDAPTAAPSERPPLAAAGEVYGPANVEQILLRFEPYQTGLSDREVRAVAETIVAESARYDVDYRLVLAVIHTESGFLNHARSKVGALGLMQIMPRTGEMLAGELEIPWRGPETLFDPITNIRMGTRYLAFLHARYQDWDVALAAYNWGPHAIDRRMRRGTALPKLYVEAVTARF